MLRNRKTQIKALTSSWLPLIFGVVALLSAPKIQAVSEAPQASKSDPVWHIQLNGDTGQLEFRALGKPNALKIHGKGSAPKGDLSLKGNAVSGSLRFDLQSLDTGIELRNKHMKEKYLETSKYSEAVLTLTKMSVPEALEAADGSVEQAPFQGMLSLHGVQKPVSGLANLKRAKDKITVDASFGIKTSDFGITTPSFAGVTLAEDVQVSVQTSAPFTSKPQ